jgi:protocatechuate 3,4-dioxygenase beta subunit
VHQGSRAFAAFLIGVAFGGVTGCDGSRSPIEKTSESQAVEAPRSTPRKEEKGIGRGSGSASGSGKRGTGSMSGRVLDADGSPLAGARIELHTDWMTEEDRSAIRDPVCTTDSAGRYRIDGLKEHPGHRLLVKHERHALGWLYYIVIQENANTENPDLRLERGRSIRGRVVDKAGRPVAGARIEAEVAWIYNFAGPNPLEAMATLETRDYTTDADGRYEVPYLRAPRYAIRASKERFLPAEVDVRFARADSITAPDIVLEESLRFSLKVMDRAARPIVDAAVLLAGRGVPQNVLRTDAAGVLMVEDLEELPSGLEISAPGYVPRTVESPGPAVEIVLEREEPSRK